MIAKTWYRKQLKKRPRIYIMPTRMGGYLNGLVFLMFLLAVGYNNNLLLIFTLFLFGLNLIWVIQTHFHLHALKLDKVIIEDGHALEPLHVNVAWKKTPEAPYRWMLTLENEQSLDLSVLDNSSGESKAVVTIDKRGVREFQHLGVKTEMPFGLYKAWIYFPVKTLVHVWPAKIQDVPMTANTPSFIEGDQSSLMKGPHDVWNLGPYQHDESRKISWKHYARSGELVIKEGEELTKSLVHFRVTNDPENKEHHLSKIATMMVRCARTDVAFSLETPHKRFDADSSLKHLHECLRELARC